MAVQHFDGGGAVWARQEAPAPPAPTSAPAAGAYTYADFLKTVKPGMLDGSGKFLGPQAGIDYSLEGLTPQEIWARSNDDIHMRDRISTNPAAGKPIDLSWKPGKEDHGGFFGNMVHDVSSNPVAMLALAAITGGATGLLGGGAALGADEAALAAFDASQAGTAAGVAAGAGAGGSADLAALHSAAGYGATNTATGLAGSLGMNAGYGATALNTGALNSGMGLIRGQNIGDALKTGATSALLSPIGSYVGDAVGGGYMGQVAGNTVLGGAQGAINGQGFAKGASNGLVNGLVSSAGSYMGGLAKGATGSNFAGTAANSLTQSALKGGDPNATIDSLASQYASGELKDLTGMDPTMAKLVVDAARGKKLDPAGALTQYARSTANAVGGSALKRAAMGTGAVGALTQTGG